MLPADEHSVYLLSCFQRSGDTPVVMVAGELCSTRGVNAVQVRAVVHGAAVGLPGLWETRFLKGCHTERSSAVS